MTTSPFRPAEGRRPSQDDRLRANAALRQWSASLRVWSQEARARAQETTALSASRATAAWVAYALLDPRAQHEPGAAPFGRPARDPGPDVVPGPGPAVATFGDVTVAELCQILVRHHGVSPHEAVLGIAMEMELAGYPLESNAVGAADALGIVVKVLERRS